MKIDTSQDILMVMDRHVIVIPFPKLPWWYPFKQHYYHAWYDGVTAVNTSIQNKTGIS
jgi:hypothetical protein